MATFRSATSLLAGDHFNSVLSAPASDAVDDIYIVPLDIENDVSPTFTGFTQLTDIDHASVTDDLFVWWKRAVAGDVSAANFTISHGSTWTNGYMQAVQNASTTIDPWVGSPNQGTSATATALGVTPLGDNACITLIVATFADMGIVSAPTNFTTQYNGTNNLYVATWNQTSGPTATGNVAVTINSTNWMAILSVVEDTATTTGGQPYSRRLHGVPYMGAGNQLMGGKY